MLRCVGDIIWRCRRSIQCDSFEFIGHARVPVITFKHQDTGTRLITRKHSHSLPSALVAVCSSLPFARQMTNNTCDHALPLLDAQFTAPLWKVAGHQ